MLKNKKIKLISCLFILTFLFLNFISTVRANQKNLNEDVVRVAWYKWKITGGTSLDNDASKYMNDYYTELEETTGLKFKYVLCEDAKDGLKRLAQNKVDILFGVSYNPVLAKKFKFIEPAATKGINALIKKRSFGEEAKYQEEKINFEKNAYNYLALKTKTIGLLDNGGGKSYNYYLNILSAKTKINAEDFKIKLYTDVKSMKDALKNGEVDYIVGVLYLTKLEDFQKVLLLNETEYHFITNYNNKILIERLSDGLKKINVVGNKYNKRLSDKYFSKYKDLIYLTEAEQKALDKQDKLYFYSREGKDFYYKKNADGTESGYYAQFAKKIAELLNKDYEFIPMKYEKRYDYKKPGLHCDLLYDYKFAQQIFHSNLLSKPTMSASALICLGKGVKVKPGMNYAGASKSMLKNILKPEDKRTFTKTDKESLNLLINGKVDAAIVSGMMRNYVSGLVRYKNIKIVKIKSNINRAFVGVYGVDNDFMLAINKAISKISKNERNSYMIKTTNSYEYEPTIIESISEYYNGLIVLLGAVLLLLIFVIRLLFKRNREIKKLAKNVKIANKSKNKFLSRMSHNMRTPLNAIINYSKFGVEENEDVVNKSYFKKIGNSSQGLLEFMKDVLDLENNFEDEKNIEHKKVVENKIWQEEVKFLVENLAKEKKINFNLITDYGVDTKYLKFDQRLKKQILLNLLINAIKYTETGGKVTWSIKTKVCSGGVLETHEITDNGVGMSEEFQKQMFKPFTIEDNSETNEEEGTGLGLAICERTVKELGGKITCTSKRGVGTTFAVEIVNERPTKKEIETYKKRIDSTRAMLHLKTKESEGLINIADITKASSIEFKSFLNVLICEDVLVNIKILEKILENEKVKIDRAFNGKLGLELVKNRQDKGLEPYDLILMDVRMPVMDGLVATSEIRKLDEEAIIVGLSANAYASDEIKALKVGMNVYLAKPIDRAEFFRTILTLLQDKIDFTIKEESIKKE